MNRRCPYCDDELEFPVLTRVGLVGFCSDGHAERFRLDNEHKAAS